LGWPVSVSVVIGVAKYSLTSPDPNPSNSTGEPAANAPIQSCPSVRLSNTAVGLSMVKRTPASVTPVAGVPNTVGSAPNCAKSIVSARTRPTATNKAATARARRRMSTSMPML
jgi:hypothetical protein